jgi:hypothetical protein
MEGNEMTEEEFEARALYEDYREELCKKRMEENEPITDEEFEKRANYDEYAEQLRRDRNVARGQGWMNDDE